ncbi:hypothetical protein A3A71_00310 [Candidatus Berkelbacteria bacterium RIFCSPLOWO2_01_FULL_50_28]|uniref:Uncharacterized protein n=1 Tax=Candidatus Berkelbacteria bacterium RIFCSPLOWO2_01_FULL_50_28 TaxID=1797471 RepID=A0A1F5EAQ9_9BACT|nr:MAG: hypothetical protein A2807_02290 [Candidatus Berkelbacteria bacterium RIFCSPHIGHO2_01_FULL_50_36]OGD63545.1 MAG: hypothetical protein A3F39_02460 [Candidatus Berkelbacteria bacterium RIFCSPHIGHO2_12_FULL_50_11]OGD64492.1 MAG: hypothetical protein A3A71_00310 [Candidatus Berkelbacteria bacterium RIFCSPLOWO2_01_FULL_50_28]
MVATNLLLLVAFGPGENTDQEAIDFGRSGYNDACIMDPFKIAGSGIELLGGVQPTDDYCELLELNDDDGKLPDNADTEFGLTAEGGKIFFLGTKQLEDGQVGAVIYASRVEYDEKPEPEAAAETATEGGGADAPAATAGAEEAPAGDPPEDAGTATEEVAAEPEAEATAEATGEPAADAPAAEATTEEPPAGEPAAEEPATEASTATEEPAADAAKTDGE